MEYNLVFLWASLFGEAYPTHCYFINCLPYTLLEEAIGTIRTIDRKRPQNKVTFSEDPMAQRRNQFCLADSISLI